MVKALTWDLLQKLACIGANDTHAIGFGDRERWPHIKVSVHNVIW